MAGVAKAGDESAAVVQEVGDRWDALPGWYKLASAILAPVGTILAVLLGARELLDLKGPGWAKVLAYLVALLVVGAVAAVYVEQFRHRREITTLRERQKLELDEYKRNARVAVALPEIHEAHHRLRDAAVMIRAGDSLDAYRPALVDSLNHIAQAFSAITGAPCRMSIKELRVTDDAPAKFDLLANKHWLKVSTLCRHIDAPPGPKDAPTPLLGNTDFERVLDPPPSVRCFFSNDLGKELNYANSHRSDNPDETTTNPRSSGQSKSRKPPTEPAFLGSSVSILTRRTSSASRMTLT